MRQNLIKFSPNEFDIGAAQKLKKEQKRLADEKMYEF